MFHGTIYNGKKGPAQFWDKEWGTMNSERYDYFILSRIGDFFEEERLHNRQPIFQHDNAACHRSYETAYNLDYRQLPTIE